MPTQPSAPKPVQLKIGIRYDGRDAIVDQSLCRQMVESGELTKERHYALFWPGPGQDTTPARSICGACPVEAECREFALVIREKRGIYGGTTGRDRAIILSNRRRAEREKAREKNVTKGTSRRKQNTRQDVSGSKTPPRPGQPGGR